ncbi:elongation factor P maturation arginine rhamnosyltransferase EarP [Pararobbsia alpina]|uniref:Protein-arginine rhamnosyltransferase n=1 Tax=Pararobbsia alpina TaxID=621374 RepID=A0A6S7B4T7_9BURK|nr:elongation factor P maturation arginine rhamnosyltransferase EarP [Pararobbsia alpina]CAB3787107.1 hypothetical protein LMG28138_02362 [Pararobbsia alpina]
MTSRPLACDIFCTVVDNFGDIGVAWRLARQLAAEYKWSVRLWVDDLTTFAQLAPGLDSARRWQRHGDIVVEHWGEPLGEQETLQIADVVIETFGCDLPAAYLAAMADRSSAPVWINFDYLSAEDWVRDFHLRPSPHPRLPLIKWFFFPGLGLHTGGVLIERSLATERATFQSDPSARHALFDALGIPMPVADTTVVSLFAYENPAVASLLQQWRESPTPVLALVPVGRIGPQIAQFLDLPRFDASVRETRGALSIHALPFVDHPTYDRLLWSCDLNFVRGEDSFVRAQLAGRPFVWHIYPQHDDAHLPKLEAALARYGRNVDAPAARALQRLWHMWNGVSAPADGPCADHADHDPARGLLTRTPPSDVPVAAGSAREPARDLGPQDHWQSFLRYRVALDARARDWLADLEAPGHVAANLAEFVESRLK